MWDMSFCLLYKLWFIWWLKKWKAENAWSMFSLSRAAVLDPSSNCHSPLRPSLVWEKTNSILCWVFMSGYCLKSLQESLLHPTIQIVKLKVRMKWVLNGISSQIGFPLFKHNAQFGSRLPWQKLILPTFKFRPRKGVFWGGIEGVLSTYISSLIQKGVTAE